MTLNAQTLSDSTVLHPLNEVEVKASRPSSFQSVAPLQTLQAKDWLKMNALQVSDALKYFSGIQIKDYGGIGGLKTISIRSLGANYSGISYDGIIVYDYQTGQSDLSRFSLENLQSLTVSIGENDQIFQTARHRASAGTLTLVTPAFSPENEKKEIKAALKGGSFGLFNPSASLTTSLNKTFSLNVFGEYLQSEGNYPYKQPSEYNPDSTSIKHRNNSDVTYYTFEANLSGKFNNEGKLRLKTNYYRSNRGIPGPAIYYNTYSGERSKDQTVFSQLNYTQKLNRLFDFQTNAKFSYSSNDYTDKNNKYPDGLLETFYYQREYYLNMTWLYTVSEKLSFSWANDGIYGNFSNSFQYCPFPSRINWLSALSGKYELPRFTLTGSLLNQFTEDRKRIDHSTKSNWHLSPYLGFSVKPSETLPVRLRGYYKNTYRFPTFGDMYLSSVPNNNLQPENADQYNFGVTFATSFGNRFSLLSFSGDGYNNRIKNKIIALPRSSMFIWSVQNYGKTDIKGLDLNLKMQFSWNKKLVCSLSGAYTYQQVLDKTDKDSQMYNQQLPYTPRHTASGTIRIETPWGDLNYTLLYCGKRYYERINRPEYQMRSYADQGISLQKNIRWKSHQWLLTAECLNFSNESYEVVRSFPMPGRSFRLGVKYNYEL
ncbi:MAG: TonB-dependent receptor [Candidatus Azobacteroides sp.]|nr:TonB-dependent receptor [Candidatus Azobacteroides sp.]